MESSTIPEDVVLEDIITYLPLGEIFAFCQSQIRSISYRCQSQRYWQEIGHHKYPILTKFIDDKIYSSLGKFYRDFAEMMFVIHEFLKTEDMVTLRFIADRKFPLNQDKFDLSSIIKEKDYNHWILDFVNFYETFIVDLILLHNGHYHLDIEDDNLQERHMMTSEELTRFFLILFLMGRVYDVTSPEDPNVRRPDDLLETLATDIYGPLQPVIQYSLPDEEYN